MEERMSKSLFAFFVIALMSMNVFSQGKILSKEEADKLFGPVLVSKEIPSSTLKELVSKSVEVIMFNIVDDDVYILGDDRKVLLPAGLNIKSTDKYHVFSTLIVQELLSRGSNPTTYIEQREKVLTISNGNITLEYSWICPPICPD